MADAPHTARAASKASLPSMALSSCRLGQLSPLSMDHMPQRMPTISSSLPLRCLLAQAHLREPPRQCLSCLARWTPPCMAQPWCRLWTKAWPAPFLAPLGDTSVGAHSSGEVASGSKRRGEGRGLMLLQALSPCKQHSSLLELSSSRGGGAGEEAPPADAPNSIPRLWDDVLMYVLYHSWEQGMVQTSVVCLACRS